MDEHAGRITIIASSTMVHQRVRCLVCDRPVDHRVVFMTNDARVLHAGCVPDHVKVPISVLLQAIRRLERMVERARAGEVGDQANGGSTPGASPPESSTPGASPPGASPPEASPPGAAPRPPGGGD